MLDLLEQIMSKCKCSIYLDIDEHKSERYSAKRWLQEEQDQALAGQLPAEANVISEMIVRDTIIHLRCYQHTPIGFHWVYHYDLEMALKEMIKVLDVNP